jgi:hypothetical protein
VNAGVTLKTTLLRRSFIETTARYYQTALTARSDVDLAPVKADERLRDTTADLVIAIDPYFQHPGELLKARGATVLILIDVHLQLDMRLAYARYFDHVFIAQPDYLDAFRTIGHPSVHALPLGCDPSIHFVPGLLREIDVAFVGKYGAPGTERERVLRAVLPHYRTNEIGKFEPPEQMGRIYSGAKVVFNKSINGDVNMRVFEALASGALLVTDRVENGLDDVGIEGVHFVCYDTADQAIAMIDHFLANDAERGKIAAAGQAHAFACHTYAHRVNKVLETIAANPLARAPARTVSARVEAEWRTALMRVRGARLDEVAETVMTTPWSARSLQNAAVAAARGIVRPLWQKITTASARRPSP